MKRLLLLASLVFLGACGKHERDPSQWPIAKNELLHEEPPVDPGEAAYRRTCIACHMSDGRGNGGRTAADLTSADGLLSQPDDAVRAVIRDGRRGAIGVMPAHGTILTPSELDAVVAYLRRDLAKNVVVRAAEPVPEAAAQ